VNRDAVNNESSPGSTPPTPTAAPTPAKPSGPLEPGSAVPNKASEDDPRAWGDSESDNDHDAWLKEQKPPHWG
jgi:hypothetical protein